MPTNDSHTWRRAERRSLAALALIGTASLVGLVLAWRGHPADGTLRYELAKTFMQVLAVAVVGGLAAIATWSFQHNRSEQSRYAQWQAEETERALERDRQAAARATERQRQVAAGLREERRRQDDQLRSTLETTLASYNRVKRVRRLLAAETNDGGRGRLRLEVYDKHLDRLIDEQLTFESLKRLNPFIDDPRLARAERAADDDASDTDYPPLATVYKRIEKYLNTVIKEYKKQRHVVVAARDGVTLDRLPALRGFIDSDDFVPDAADQIDEIVEAFQAALREPLVLPGPAPDG